MKSIKITIQPEVVEVFAPLFDKKGFPTEIIDVDGKIIRGLHTVEHLRERFEKILSFLEKVQSSGELK